jgi:hypothetical protein
MEPEFRHQFRTLRRAAGVSQTQLARRLGGTTRQRISRWEKSRIHLSHVEQKMLDRECRALTERAHAEHRETKLCWDCKQTLSTQDFALDKSRSDGRQSRCRTCSRANSMRRRRQLGTSSWRPRENQTWANNQPTRRDFDELNLVGDGMHLVDSPVLRGRARYDSELSSHPVIRKLRRDARAGILNYVSDREELLRMPEVP